MLKKNACKLYLGLVIPHFCWSVSFFANGRCAATLNNRLCSHTFSNSMWWLISLCYVLEILFHSSSAPSLCLPLWSCYFDQLLTISFYRNNFGPSWAVPIWENELNWILIASLTGLCFIISPSASLLIPYDTCLQTEPMSVPVKKRIYYFSF